MVLYCHGSSKLHQHHLYLLHVHQEVHVYAKVVLFSSIPSHYFNNVYMFNVCYRIDMRNTAPRDKVHIWSVQCYILNQPSYTRTSFDIGQ